MKKSEKNVFEADGFTRFDKFLTELVKVPKDEILKREKEEKEKNKERKAKKS